MDLDGELEAPPENCGVEFEEKCFSDNLPPLSNPEDDEEEGLLECEGDDEYCGRHKSITDQDGMLRKSRSASVYNRQSIKKTLSEVKRPSLTTKSGTYFAGIEPEPLFEGLPQDYYKKNYKPDYPSELKMKLECALKAGIKKSSGITKTHPKAVFKPSETKITTVGKALDPRLQAILEEPSPLELNRMPPPIVSSSDEVIVDWLMDHNIQMMLEYFLSLCVIHRPDDPWQFISQLCAKMIEARTDIEVFDNLPRILTTEHIEAIFRIYDRIENGYINVSQYKSAMEAMGFNRFSLTPEGVEKNEITKDTFVKEATEAINQSLRSFMVYEEEPGEEGKSGSKKSISSSKKSVDIDFPRLSLRDGEEEEEEALSGTGSYTSTEEYTDEAEEGEGYDENEEPEPFIEQQKSQQVKPEETTATPEEGEEEAEEGEFYQHYEEDEEGAEFNLT